MNDQSINIPAVNSEEKYSLYRKWQSKVKVQSIDIQVENSIDVCRNKDPESQTLFFQDPGKWYESDKPSSADISRNIVNQMECSLSSFYPMLYLLCQQPNGEEGVLLTKKSNAFCVWNDRLSNFYGVRVYWSNEIPAYTDRHCGTPYLEFDAVPAGWIMEPFSLLPTNLPASRIFSPKSIDFSK